MTQHIMEEQGQDTEIQQMADRITTLFSEALVALLERRDKRFTDEIAPLKIERKVLEQEYAAIEGAAHNLKAILPAKEREAQRAADALLLSGKSEEAHAKLAEAQQVAEAPQAMQARQSEIAHRIETIGTEERSIARHIFNEWYGECQHIVRAGERGLFCVLLDQLESSFYSYQESTGTGTSDNRQRPLLHQGHIAGLTSDERSPEWQAGTRWYGGRR